MTVKLLADVDPSIDHVFDVLIVKGEALYLSDWHRQMQRAEGLGRPGSKISLRTTLTQFKRRIELGRPKP